MTNEELKDELIKRGYYVIEVKRGGDAEYLVVTTSPPLDSGITDHIAS